MQEFSSISVSSYDASSLADRLTQQSADGWEVVAIVPAGTNIVAYLARHTDSMLVIPDTSETDTDTGSDSDAGHAAETGAETAAEPAAQDYSFTLAGTSTPEAAAAETALADDTPEPVEPAGWASEPEPTPEPEPEPEPQPFVAETTQVAAADESYQASHDAAAEGATSTDSQQAAAAGAAPAGWYADPAGRYELRYWDGTQWTEHVSRAGQQYTDPPVA